MGEIGQDYCDKKKATRKGCQKQELHKQYLWVFETQRGAQYKQEESHSFRQWQ